MSVKFDRVVLTDNQREHFRFAGLDADTAQEMSDAVHRCQHRLTTESMCEELGRDSESWKGAHALLVAVWKRDDILGPECSVKGSGFGYPGMVGAVGTEITIADLTPEYLVSAKSRLDQVREANLFNFGPKGNAKLTSLSGIVEPGVRSATARLTIALVAGKIPGYSYSTKSQLVSYTDPAATKAA